MRKIYNLILRLLYFFRIIKITNYCIDRYYLLILRKKLNNITRRPLTLVRRIFNVVIITDQKSYFKIGYAEPNTLYLEYENCISLTKHYPSIEPFLPNIQFHWLGNAPCLCTNALAPLDKKETITFARKVLKAFSNYSNHRLGTLDELNCVTKGLRYFDQNSIDQPGLTQVILDIMAQEFFFFGPCHGDFHASNLMKGDSGQPVVIDLDCARKQSIQAFDALYFNIEQEVNQLGVNWLEVLRRFLNDKDQQRFLPLTDNTTSFSPSLILLYTLDRIGQELKYGITPNLVISKSLIQLIISRIQEQ